MTHKMTLQWPSLLISTGQRVCHPMIGLMCSVSSLHMADGMKTWQPCMTLCTNVHFQHRPCLRFGRFSCYFLCAHSSIVNLPGESMLRREFLRLQQETHSQTQLLQQVHNQDNYKRQLLADRQKRIQQQQEERRRLEDVWMNFFFFLRLCNERMSTFQRRNVCFTMQMESDTLCFTLQHLALLQV